MNGRYYVLLVVFLAAVALIAILAAFAGAFYSDPELREEAEDLSATSTGTYVCTFDEIYVKNGISHYPSVGCKFVIVYVDVTNNNTDPMVLSPADFKLLVNGASQPIAYYQYFNTTAQKGQDVHGEICYEVSENTIKSEIQFKYSGPYKINLSETLLEKKNF